MRTLVRGLVAVLVLSLGVGSRARADQEACLSAHERAQVERLEGHYLTAQKSLLACAQRECPALISNECTTWLSQLEAALPTVVFAVQDTLGRDLIDVRTSLDGRLLADRIDGRAVALDPGVYRLRFEAVDYAPVEQSLSIRDGEKHRLVHVVMQPQDSAASPSRSEHLPVDPRAQRLWLASYALGAASVISFAITLGAGARGHRMQKHCNDDDCSDGYADHGKALYRTVNTSAIVGGVLTVATLGTLWSALRRDANTGADSRSQGPAKLRAQNVSGASTFDLGGYADSRGATLTAWGRW